MMNGSDLAIPAKDIADVMYVRLGHRHISA
jgi:hypothetical protein